VEQPRQVESIAADFGLQAQKQQRQGDLDMAAATLERGLRLAPKDPFLWSQLAEVRLLQKNYQQARTLAAKSSSLAGSDRTIVNKNNWIINQALQQSGAN
jgi:Flp pilus assembly protein TadD